MSRVRVIDGGFSTQLSRHVQARIDGDPLWTARFLVTDPDAVFTTHLDFLRAGADIIETNTYQATSDGFERYLGFAEDESLRLMEEAVKCARKARTVYEKETTEETQKEEKEEKEENRTRSERQQVLIAGSCGPYGAALHDGSEYTGSYGHQVSTELLVKWHRPRIRALLDAGVDLLALETIPCRHEAEALVDLLKEFPTAKAWLAFSCRDDGRSIADGSDFRKVALGCYARAAPGQLLAVGVNCIAPRFAHTLLAGLRNPSRARDSDDFELDLPPLVVYPNSGERYTVEEGWRREGDHYPPLEEFVPAWLDLGVEYVGGCCRTGADDVRRIRAEVDRWEKINDRS